MFYFIHGTSYQNFKKILKKEYIYASYYLPNKQTRLGGQITSKFIYTNIFVDNLPLNKDEKSGFGEITFIIDPIILKYKTCYFNPGWYGNINENTIIMNHNIRLVLDLVKQNYRYPLVTSHEAMFRKKISTMFVIGIICEPDLKNSVRYYLNKYGYYHVQIFNQFPTLL